MNGRGDIKSFPFTYVGYFYIPPNIANMQCVLAFEDFQFMPSMNTMINIENNSILFRITNPAIVLSEKGYMIILVFTYCGYFKIWPNISNIQLILAFQPC